MEDYANDKVYLTEAVEKRDKVRKGAAEQRYMCPFRPFSAGDV